MSYDREYMQQALALACMAREADEVPVGAVIARDGVVVSEGYNRPVATTDATAHAEIIAIRSACETLGTERLEGCTLYVTLEPCPMCAGAIVLARLDRLVFGAYDIKAGATGTLYSITTDKRLNHYVETLGGVMDEECAELLRKYFREKRVGTGK